MDISNRQIKLLQFIIDEYTLTVQPVSSKVIVDKYFFNLSPQTIRNEMLYLEKIGLLEKTHTSSGRIPSLNGYKFYEMNILKPYLSNDVKNQLKVIFQKRDLSIDMIINESASLIEEILKLPTVVASQDSNVLLKRFDLIPITDQKVLLLLVTSNGDVIKNDISITNNKELDDVIICVKIFNDRLIDTPLNQITQKLSIIKEICFHTEALSKSDKTLFKRSTFWNSGCDIKDLTPYTWCFCGAVLKSKIFLIIFCSTNSWRLAEVGYND